VSGAAFAGMVAGVQGPSSAKVVCRLCDGGARHIERVGMPFVFKYLATELAAMNIKVSLAVK
jgi:DNA-directed RNA polymerase I subunit RPA2